MSNDLADNSNPDSITFENSSSPGTGTMTSGQKRQRDDRGGPVSKKAHITESEENVQVKVLIPAAAVGALIGKGGETMRSLKNESGCRLQMSKNQDVYPGTNERICLVKGKIAAAMKVAETMLEKIREKVDSSTPSDVFDHKGMDRKNEMKLVVPNTSAGMVIGKSGARIKEIREQTGANIQVYPKAGSQEAKVSQERVITIAAEQTDVLMDALLRVLEKVAADPQHAILTDHKDEFGLGGQTTIQPFDFTGRQMSGQQYTGGQQQYGQAGAAQVWQPNQQRALEASYVTQPKDMYSNSNSYKFNPMQGVGNNELMSFLDSLQSTLRTSGFNETSVAEVMQAMQVLAKYNIMGLGLGLGVAAMAQMRSNDPGVMQGGQGMQQQQQQQQQRYDTTSLTSGSNSMIDTSDRRYGMGNSGGGGQNDINKSLSGVGGVLIDVLSQSKQNNAPNTQNFASSVIKEKQVDNNHIDLEIPDTIVGAVLGPRAKTLAEIQHLSGCKVEVHKRGALAGQGNRLVSLTGEVECIRNGRLMIEKVINDEQIRRSQQPHHNRSAFL